VCACVCVCVCVCWSGYVQEMWKDVVLKVSVTERAQACRSPPNIHKQDQKRVYHASTMLSSHCKLIQSDALHGTVPKGP
jgi:hypothetical protein